MVGTQNPRITLLKISIFLRVKIRLFSFWVTQSNKKQFRKSNGGDLKSMKKVQVVL